MGLLKWLFASRTISRPRFSGSVVFDPESMAIQDAATLLGVDFHLLYCLWNCGKFTKVHNFRANNGANYSKRNKSIKLKELEAFEAWYKSSTFIAPEVTHAAAARQLVQIGAESRVDTPIVRRRYQSTRVYKRDNKCPMCFGMFAGPGFSDHLAICGHSRIASGVIGYGHALAACQSVRPHHFVNGTPYMDVLNGLAPTVPNARAMRK